MDDFRAALDDFFTGRLDLEGLLGRLDAQLLLNPESRTELTALLEELQHSNRIPTQIVTSLRVRLDQYAQPAQDAAGEETRIHSDLEADRLPPIPDEATRIAGTPTPSPSPAAQTWSAPAPHQASGRAAHPLVGDTLNGRFVLEDEIGRGGMGVVYLAKDLRKEEARDREPYVAIKVLNEAVQQNSDAFIALQREAKKAQRLAHPNVATVYDFDRDGDTVYMTMELMQGESVEHLIKRIRPSGLPMEKALPIIEGMAHGLAYAHKKDIVHADFKPGNAFILQNGEIKVLDFGIARAFKPPGQSSGDATVFDPAKWEALTPAYASCEMFDQAAPDPRDDIYALGCVSYELLTGHHPFDKLPANQARGRKLIPKPIPGLSRQLNQALAHSLAFERSERTPDLEQFLQELKGGSGANLKLRGLAVAISLLLAVVGIGIYLLIGEESDKPKDSLLPVPAVEPLVKTTPMPVVRLEPSEPDEFEEAPAAGAKPEPEPKPGKLDAETQAKVERILEVAALHRMIGRHLEPKGSNAVEAYRAVLDLDPENRIAREGLDQVANHFVNQAKQAMKQGDNSAAQTLLDQGLQAAPEHRELQILKRRLQSE
ncbi:MAG: serine/threonine protein kinase [Gammaproteobacteria bacterium (ex Lamellibrachia satsuma)]|nr:MAG: serine/threonine protein kinase [Gammaproteobacteria bacterium (ex Lamellibrachia satsuma)]